MDVDVSGGEWCVEERGIGDTRNRMNEHGLDNTGERE